MPITTLSLFLEKMTQRGANDKLKTQFVSLYTRYLSGETGQVVWEEVEQLEDSDLIPLETLPEHYRRLGEKAISKWGVVKLNGGLGTSMGCKGPKSIIPIHETQTFLDIIADQVKDLQTHYGVKIPLILMNSVATSEDTKLALSGKLAFTELIQNDFPRVDVLSKDPFSCPHDRSQEWSPAGHGDFYLSLVESGLLDQLISQGIEYLFISNADNLGPSFEPRILGYMEEHGCDFVMETTPKTKLDVKGGTLIRHGGRLELLERAQVPEAHIPEFEDITQFHVFNTNNIWVRLSAIKRLYANPVLLPLIVNPKKIEGHPVVQLESAIGSALTFFDQSVSIVVGRDRFLPVKKTSDLMVIKSDLVQKNENKTLEFGSETLLHAGYPDIRLSEHFQDMASFNRRIQAMPSLKGIEQLVLDGDIVIGPGVSFKGTVSIKVLPGKSVYLENQTFENQTLIFD